MKSVKDIIWKLSLLAVPPGYLVACPEGVVPLAPVGYLLPEGFFVPLEPFIILNIIY